MERDNLAKIVLPCAKWHFFWKKNQKYAEQILEVLFLAKKISVLEGLIALEEFSSKNRGKITDKQLSDFFAYACYMVVDGTEPKEVQIALENGIYTMGTKNARGYLGYLIMVGILDIQGTSMEYDFITKMRCCLPLKMQKKFESIRSDSKYFV